LLIIISPEVIYVQLVFLEVLKFGIKKNYYYSYSEFLCLFKIAFENVPVHLELFLKGCFYSKDWDKYADFGINIIKSFSSSLSKK